MAGAISPHDRSTLTGMGIKRVIEKPNGNEELKRLLTNLAREVCGSA